MSHETQCAYCMATCATYRADFGIICSDCAEERGMPFTHNDCQFCGVDYIVECSDAEDQESFCGEGCESEPADAYLRDREAYGDRMVER